MSLIKGFIPAVDPTYGEMYAYDTAGTNAIGTTGTPVALAHIVTGLVSGFTFNYAAIADMDAFVDHSGTVPGTVRVFNAGHHTFTTGDIITISGTTNYNGIFKVTRIDDDNFYIVAAWAGDDGISHCVRGTSLIALAGSAGVYTSTWQMTTAPSAGCELRFKVNINETPQNKSTAGRDMAVNDKDNNSSTCLLEIVVGDIIWLSVESDSLATITNLLGNINLVRVKV